MYTLTVAILSYNRPKELLRSIDSLLPLPYGVCISIYDDHSTKIQEIRSVINHLLNETTIKLHENEINVGYDQNLLSAITNSQTPYVLLLSDDDTVEENCLSNLMDFLGHNDVKAGFLRVRHSLALMKRDGKKNIIYDRKYKIDTFFDKSEITNNGNYLYNAILFSGLIFSRNAVQEISEKLKHYSTSIYIQVAIFALTSRRFGSYYICGPGVMIHSDGENGFGVNEASVGQEDLVDRSGIMSNLKYNQRLIQVINQLSLDFGNKFKNNFFRAFNLRHSSGMLRARRLGRSMLSAYWLELSAITQAQNWLHKSIYLFMYVCPYTISNLIFSFLNKVRRSIL